jgi:streptomycin 6-kinase
MWSILEAGSDNALDRRPWTDDPDQRPGTMSRRHHGAVSDIGERLGSAAAAWGLDIGGELAGGTSSAVFAACDTDGRDLVLKVPTQGAGGSDAARAEAAALTSWAGTGAAVRLVDSTADALLLVRARPRSRPTIPPI